jgi:ubiquinone/menaquinone biosynthesis C-methylase UbiE
LSDPISSDADEIRAAVARRRLAAYDSCFGPVTSSFLPLLVRALPESGLVADLGAGSGALSVLATTSARSCVAVDVEPHVVAVCRRKGIPALVASVEALPFVNAGLDAVAGAFVVPHVHDLMATFTEVERVLRPGGAVVQVTWAPSSESPFAGLAWDCLKRHAGESVTAILESIGERTSAASLAQLARSAGLDGVDVEALRTTTTVETPRVWWHGMLGASLGLSQLLQVTSPDVRRVVQDDFLREAEQFRSGSVLRVPVAVHLLTACRPR